MKKLIALLLVAACAFAWIYRDRLYVRDPLGSVTRDGAKESGAQVFVNHANDVLLENDNAPMYLDLFRHGQPPVGPDGLQCIHYLICLAQDTYPDANHLQQVQLESMTDRAVTFRDAQQREVAIKLR